MTIAAAPGHMQRIESALQEDELIAQPVGAARGPAEAAELLVVAIPSIVTLALLAEKLRRLNLPRTYIDLRGPEGPDITVDDRVKDGRTFAIQLDGTMKPLPDREIGVDVLQKAFGDSQPDDA